MRISSSVAVLAFAAALAGGAAAQAQTAPAFDAARISEDIRVLSDDSFEGRGIATPAEQKVIDYLSRQYAAAGFAPGDLSVPVEDNQLVIRGKQAEDAARSYLHRGIAARQFQRSFVLADGMEVAGADLENGLLSLRLVRRRPEPKVRTIAINAGVQE